MTLHTDELRLNPAFLADAAGTDTIREVSQRYGCSFGFVQGIRTKGVAANTPTTLPPATEESAPEGQRITWTGTEGELFVVIHEEMTHENILRKFGHPPESVRIVGTLDETHWQFGTGVFNHRYKFKTQRRDPETGEWPEVVAGQQVPRWPVVQPARDPYVIKPISRTPRASRFKTAVVGADTQIGFDIDEQGNLIPYHDTRAIDIFYQIVAAENPDQTIVAGDILDLTEQSRWSQESRFARSTQPSLDYGREFAANTRARTSGEVVWIEGNHDKRMSAFMETNALAAMNLRKSGYPDSYPVLSIPNLIGLDEFGVTYIDAYPAGAHWITQNLRVIHGTKANSAGSTAAQYANDMPHISTIFGHTHRQEVQPKTTFDRAGKIKSNNINPGCLCRVDGAVPSVHGARHLDGSKATYWENWQQGVTVVRYLDSGEFFYEQVQIEEGRALHHGQELIAEELRPGLKLVA